VVIKSNVTTVVCKAFALLLLETVGLKKHLITWFWFGDYFCFKNISENRNIKKSFCKQMKTLEFYVLAACFSTVGVAVEVAEAGVGDVVSDFSSEG
jgi:hypothetical protein